MAKLLINGKDALVTWGVRMGDGFIEALNPPLEHKELVSFETRMMHGKSYAIRDSNGNSLLRFKARDLTLIFTIEGKNQQDLVNKRNAFYQVLYDAELTIQVPADSSNVYHLVYKGKPSAYAHNIQRTFCKVSLKFEEPNPTIRS